MKISIEVCKNGYYIHAYHISLITRDWDYVAKDFGELLVVMKKLLGEEKQ